ALERPLRGGNGHVRRLGAGALRLRGVAAGVDVVAPVARVDSLPRRVGAAGAGVDDDAGVAVGLGIARVEVAPVLDRPAEVPVRVADGDRERRAESLLEAERVLVLADPFQVVLEQLGEEAPLREGLLADRRVLRQGLRAGAGVI